MDDTLRDIEAFIRTQHRQLQIDVVMAGNEGGVGWEITNYNMDSVPLLGWSWEHDHVTATGATLAIAWTNFKREACGIHA